MEGESDPGAVRLSGKGGRRLRLGASSALRLDGEGDNPSWHNWADYKAMSLLGAIDAEVGVGDSWEV